MKSRNKMKFGVMLLLLAAVGSSFAIPEEGSTVEKNRKLSWDFTPDPSLPNVLILGDSVSIGYTLQVRELLKGKANVYRPTARGGKMAQNCSGTFTGVKKLGLWLGDTQWDVIHFNWGLHDLKHVNEAGKHSISNDPNGPTLNTVEGYAKNMETIVAKLKATNARLVFATTTPVVPGTINPLREPELPAIYNAAALKIMKANGIRVNDLYTFCQANLQAWQLPKNVHFNPEGSMAQAKKIAAVIEEELAACAK
jgi:acyl-CoA thioesterase-1